MLESGRGEGRGEGCVCNCWRVCCVLNCAGLVWKSLLGAHCVWMSGC